MSVHTVLPQHENPPPERAATAPYNFVPLPETVVTAAENAEQLPAQDTYTDPRYPHTGYFEVSLTTRSPLYVRCGLEREMFDYQDQNKDRHGRPLGSNPRYADRIKNTPEFFYTEKKEEPVILGSSLRGMLRTLLEIVSYGKLTGVADRRIVYRAVGDRTSLGNWYRTQMLGPNKARQPHMQFDYPRRSVKAGYLCRLGSGWGIQPAKEFHGESFVHVEYRTATPIIGGKDRQKFHKVYVAPAPRKLSHRPPRGRGRLALDLAVSSQLAARTASSAAPRGMEKAVLVESGHMGGRHPKHMHCAIYEHDPDAHPIPIPPEIWEAYEEDPDMVRGIKARKLTKESEPLFYLLDDNGRLVFFGPTMMFRIPYAATVQEKIPEELRNPLAIDYADALFGYVRKPDDFPPASVPDQGRAARAYAGRVAITDGRLADHLSPNDLWLDSRQATMPDILASPKPTCFQHYLVQKAAEVGDLSHYDSPKKDDRGYRRGHKTVIRGHKLYWHRGNRSREQLRAAGPVSDTSTQHTQIKPVRANVGFRFRVYFENLSDRELGALCWALHPGGGDGRDYCHHLGMGKAMGMGSIKLEATLHLTNRAERYASLFGGQGWQMGQRGKGESLSNPEALAARVKPFEEHVLEVLQPNPRCARLTALRRIGLLLKMLDWDEQRTDRETKTMELSEFRNRKVLPDPSAYGAPLSADAAATARRTQTAGAETPWAEHRGERPPPGRLIQDPALPIVGKIQSLGGAGEGAKIPGIVEEILALGDTQDQAKCADLLRAWLKQQKNFHRKHRKQGSKWLEQLNALPTKGGR